MHYFIQNPWENKFLELVDNIHEELFIINPFIKKNIIEKILASLKNKKLKILLKTNVFDMANNVFDLDSLYLLNACNTEIRTIRNLHAKLFIFDNEKVIVTSSNLTDAGLSSNIEFGILIEDDIFIKENILPIVNKYWENGQKIDTNEIDKIKSELHKVNSIKYKLSSFEFEKPQITTLGTFVPPLGKDNQREDEELSPNIKHKIIANILMKEKDLDKIEILSLIKNYFGDKYIEENLSKICLGGLHHSFNSDYPFTTAGIYYKNVLKVFPKFKDHFSATLDNMFKNMIMEKGRTNVKIQTLEDYYRLRNEFLENFSIIPPKSVKILEVVLNDAKCINEMVENIEYYYRIENIFYARNRKYMLKQLKSIILKKLEENYKSLIVKRQSEVAEEETKKLDLAIDEINEKVKLLRHTPLKKKKLEPQR